MNSTMSTYTKLKFHCERWAYKRGKYKGDAPADQHRRSKSHFRVSDCKEYMAVVMYNTDLIRAYPDGRIVVSMGGWHTSTTKMNLHHAIMQFVPFRIGIWTESVMSYRQLVCHLKGRMVKYYDGMEFDNEGNLLSKLMPFKAKRIDRNESKELARELKESGFTALFPLLYAAAVDEGVKGEYMHHNSEDLTNPDVAHNWKNLVARYADVGRQWRPVRDQKQTWFFIMADLKRKMYYVDDCDVYEIAT